MSSPPQLDHLPPASPHFMKEENCGARKFKFLQGARSCGELRVGVGLSPTLARILVRTSSEGDARKDGTERWSLTENPRKPTRGDAKGR